MTAGLLAVRGVIGAELAIELIDVLILLIYREIVSLGAETVECLEVRFRGDACKLPGNASERRIDALGVGARSRVVGLKRCTCGFHLGTRLRGPGWHRGCGWGGTRLERSARGSHQVTRG